jgi:hypothetical protein
MVLQTLKLRYPLFQQKPPEAHLPAIDKVATLLIGRRLSKNEKVPLIFAASPSIKLLQDLSVYVPPAVTLVTALKPATVSSRELLDHIVVGHDDGPAIRAVKDDYQSLTEKGMLVWTDFLSVAGFAKVESHITALFTKRIGTDPKYCTLLLGLVPENRSATQVLSQIEKLYGESVRLILEENATFLRFNATLNKPQFKD